MENQKTKTPGNKFFLFTYIFSTIIFLFYSLSYLPKLAGDIMEEGFSTLYSDTWEVLVMTWTYFAFTVGFALSWFKKFAAAIIILFAAVLQMAPFLIIDGNFGSLIFGVPLLVIGILLLVLNKQQIK